MTQIGILGGGQLAQMMIQAAISLGLEVAIFEREKDSPAGRLTQHEIVGAWTDPQAQADFAARCEVITLESEFVDPQILQQLADRGVPVYPTPATIAQIQDKLTQKQTMQAAGIPVPPFREVSSADDIAAAGRDLGYPLVLKARRNGYDGYGNFTLHSADDIPAGLEKLQGRELMVEGFIPFERELAIMVVRGRDGTIRPYPVVETIQQNHICHVVRAPAAIPAAMQRTATDIAIKAVTAVDGVGIFGVELFMQPDGQLLFNEIAPRPHNSGHYTIEACVTSQFENHLRAVLGWSLGSTALRTPAAVMVNLLGTHSGSADASLITGAFAHEQAHVHLYGKRLVRPGRKMGHITVLADSIEAAEAIARQAAARVEL